MSGLPPCSCGRHPRLCELMRMHILCWPGDELIGGECPHCGSTRYLPIDDATPNELCACPELEVLVYGEHWTVALARDVDAVAPTEPPPSERRDE